MGVMAAAAVIGGSGLLAVETVGMIALAAGVIGAVTENKTLMKISAGLSLGSSISGLLASGSTTGAVAGETAAGAATDSGTSALADTAATAGGEAVEDTAIQQALNGGEGTVQPGDMPASAEGVKAPQASEGLVDQAMNEPTQGTPDASAPQPVDTAPAAPAGSQQPLTGPGTMDDLTNQALAKPAPGQTYDVNSKFESDYGFKTDQTTLPTDQRVGGPNSVTDTGMRKGSTWFGDLTDGVKKWWTELKPNEKLVVGQMGAGLVSGIGKGYMEGQQLERQMKFKEEERDYRRTNLGSVPNITYNRPTGLVNSNMGGR